MLSLGRDTESRQSWGSAQGFSSTPKQSVWGSPSGQGAVAPVLAIGLSLVPVAPAPPPCLPALQGQLVTLPRITLGGSGRGVTHESVLLPWVAQMGQANQLLPRLRLPFKASGQRKELAPAARLGPMLTFSVTSASWALSFPGTARRAWAGGSCH